jgi:hypothetical protein
VKLDVLGRGRAELVGIAPPLAYLPLFSGLQADQLRVSDALFRLQRGPQ